MRDHAREWARGGDPRGRGPASTTRRVARLARPRRRGDDPSFAASTAADAEAVRTALERRHYAPGATIVRRGDAADELFLIVERPAERRPSTAGRRSAAADDARGRTVFGELAFVGRGDRRTADVHADTVVECLVLDGRGVRGARWPTSRARRRGVLANLLRMVGGTARRLTEELRSSSTDRDASGRQAPGRSQPCAGHGSQRSGRSSR